MAKIPIINPAYTQNIGTCEWFVAWVFEEIAERHGKATAQRIFAPYGKISKRANRLESDALLLWMCDEMRPLNVRRLAAQLSEKNGSSRVAQERKIWRVLDDKRVRNYLEQIKSSL